MLTTNLGAEAFGRTQAALGFGAGCAAAAPPERPGRPRGRRAPSALPPELWNRIDERLAFRPLEEVEVARIATLLLAESSKRLATERGIDYVAGEDVVGHLLTLGRVRSRSSARGPCARRCSGWWRRPLAERILSGEFGSGDRVRIAILSGQLAFERAQVEYRS